MSQFEDIKEKMKGEAQQLWGKIQESSAYNQLKDRFQNLSPAAQKVILALTALVLFLVLMCSSRLQLDIGVIL